MSLIRSHDALFRFIFGEPEQMAELLRARLPARLAAAMDWTSLQRLDGTFVDEALRTRQSDLLFAARMASDDVLVYVLCEHKSAPDPLVALQLARYIVRIWDRWVAERPDAPRLPAVVPFVFHHGARPWPATRTLRDLVAVSAGGAAAAELRSLQLDLNYVLLDVAGATEEDLDAQRWSAVCGLTLRFLQLLLDRPLEQALADIGRWQHLVTELLEGPRGQDRLRGLLSWFLAARPHDLGTLRTVMTKIHEENPAMRTALDLLLEIGEERGVQRGLHEGMQQGRLEGRLDGQRELLLEQLRCRFGELPAAVAARIASAAVEDLQRWARRLLTAAALDEVFAPAGS